MARFSRLSSTSQLRFFSQFLKQYIIPILVGLGAAFLAFHSMVIFLGSCFSFILITPQHNCGSEYRGNTCSKQYWQLIPWCIEHHAMGLLSGHYASRRWDRRW
ncbi:MAG: hypothetical protein LHW55_02980 [Candidatus Cloacimonetes bacterium]|nr:hypothetical protein [Candidatus Cloacimonadota bacterium]